MPLISLGSNCAVAYQMDKLGLREQAGPFDWAKISLPKLIKVLELDFAGWTDITIHHWSEKHYALVETNSGSYVLANKLGISFAHEVIKKTSLSDFISAQTRRVDRFKSQVNPTFVRLETSNIPKSYQSNYQTLCEILGKYFTDFKLIVISNNPISHAKIHWIKLDNFDEDWTYSKLDWVKIFNL